MVPNHLHSKISTVACIAAAVTIPFPNAVNSIVLVLFVATVVLVARDEDHRTRLRKDSLWKISLGYFCWLILTTIINSYSEFKIKNIEGYASFAFLPFAFCIMPRFSLLSFRRLFILFSLTIFIFCMVALVRSAIEYQQTGDFRLFNYHYLSQQVGLNAIFLSNYCLASIVGLYIFVFKNPLASPRLLRVLSAALAIFLIGMIFLLSSKMVLFLMLFFFLVIVAGEMIRRKAYFLGVFVLSLITIGTIIAITNIPYLKWRLQVLEFKRYSGPEDDQNGLAARVLMWESAVDVFKSRPVIGHGVLDPKPLLLEQYKQKGFHHGLEMRYNSHNQFLETGIMSGIIGLSLLLIFMGVLYVKAVRKNQLGFLLFLVHFTAILMVEAAFEVQQELIFFLFFALLFYYHLPSLPQTNDAAIRDRLSE